MAAGCATGWSEENTRHNLGSNQYYHSEMRHISCRITWEREGTAPEPDSNVAAWARASAIERSRESATVSLYLLNSLFSCNEKNAEVRRYIDLVEAPLRPCE